MNVEQELPLLFNQLADDHDVGAPPPLNQRANERTRVRTGRSRRLPLLAVAAGCVVLIAGLVAMGTRTTDPASSTDPVAQPVDTDGSSTETSAPSGVPIDQPSVSDPAPVAADIVVSDAEAISLDEWVDPGAIPQVAAVVVVIDRELVPAEWSVSDEAGVLYAYPNDSFGYTYTAVVTIDDQTVFDVTYQRDVIGGDACFIPVAGFTGTVGDLEGTTVGDAVCGEADDGSNLAVVPAGESAVVAPESQPSALGVANALSFVEADEVPHPDLTGLNGDIAPAEAAFAGALSDVQWAVTAELSGTRRMDLYIGGDLYTGMELSQEGLDDGQPIPVIESTLDGVAGYGAIAYGHVEGDAAAVIVTTVDGRTASLPMRPSDGRSAFAVPVPDTVEISTLTFIADDGSVIAAAWVPAIPSGFVSGTLGLIAQQAVGGSPPEIVECGDDSGFPVCLSDVESIGSDAVSALNDADGGDPGEMSAGACARSASDAGPWSICVVPLDGGQVVVGRDSGDGLSARAQVAGRDILFPLDNVEGEVIVLNGQATAFQVIDNRGTVIGDLSGIALTESGT